MNDFGKGAIYGIIVVTLVSAYGKLMYKQGVKNTREFDDVVIEGYREIVDILKKKLEKKEESE